MKETNLVISVIHRCLFLFCLLTLCTANVTEQTNGNENYVTALQDYPQILHEGDVLTLTFNWSSTGGEALQLLAISSDTDIAKIADNDTQSISNANNISVKISAIFLGRSFLNFYINSSLPGTSEVSGDTRYDTKWYSLPSKYEIVVRRKDSALNTIFTVCVIILVCLANVAMGCKTDLQVVKETLKKPIAPVTGLLSQFLLMPMISFALGYALSLEPSLAFGLFTMGCSPGGSASNVYTYLLDGNVSLSVTMTFVSTILSLGMVPLWLFTLGIRVIYHATKISIPYENIVTSLLGLIIPVVIGIIIQRKKPRWAKFILKCVKPIAVIFLILVFTLGIYANLYIFKLLKPIVLISGALVPYCGFLFGAVVAFMTRRSKADILTIAIETGIQNTGIAIVLLQLSLPPPDSDISIVPPITAAIFTPVPLIVAIIIHEVKKRCFTEKKKEIDISAIDENHFHNSTKGENHIDATVSNDDDSLNMISYTGN